METTVKEISISRTFDAPINLVFNAWADPEQLVKWFAPNDCSIYFTKIDVREGGEFHSCLTTTTGYQCWVKGTYLKIDAPNLIVQTMNMADEHGNSVEPADIGMDPEWPKETILTITFTELNGKTTLNLHQTASEIVAKRTGAYQSWGQMFERLDVLLTEF